MDRRYDTPAGEYRSVVDGTTQFLDVREPTEVATGTLPGAVNIPLGDLPMRVDDLDPQRRVVLLCRSGARSGRAADYLAALGFTDVVNLAGGMMAAPPADVTVPSSH